jgi:heme exporter protein D
VSVYWPDWASFVAMGGYAEYVWGAFGMCALVIAAECWALRARRRTLNEDTVWEDEA